MRYWWLIILVGLCVAKYVSPLYQVIAGVAILTGYISCKNMQWPRYQRMLAYLFGGLVIGAIMQSIIYYAYTKQWVALIVAPCLIGLFSRVVFLSVEEKYALVPVNPEKLAVSNTSYTANTQGNTTAENELHAGFSAWSGESSGGSALPDDTGARVMWRFEATGEIAMGGPTYGDAIFSNQCAFSGVGPSVVISDDGRYAAMTVPSRDAWGLQIADLKNKQVYALSDASFWEIDRIQHDVLYGRFSPITSNAKVKLSIKEAIATATVLPMVNDDGWWVIDYKNREPFPSYKAVTIYSSQKQHRITFVPDLTPLKTNPFQRYQHPSYKVLVDDVLLQDEVRYPTAVWIDGANHQEGRFMVLDGKVVDFYDAITHAFDVNNATTTSVHHWHESTNVHLHIFNDGGEGILLAEGYVQTRSVAFSEAEYVSNSVTSPWDEEKAEYWDAQHQKTVQVRTHIQHYLRYTIDLNKFNQVKALPLCSKISLINRSKTAHSAELHYAEGYTKEMPYVGYRCETSCGITLGLVTQEAIWSHCGRYLAVVNYVPKPSVPHSISIIDFETATVKTLPNSYVLPSFMWFDAEMLEFSHLVAVEESATAFNPWVQEKQRFELNDAIYNQQLFDLLFTNLEARRAKMEKKAKKMQTKDAYSSGSVEHIAQHCIVFAPHFNVPVLQPPNKPSEEHVG